MAFLFVVTQSFRYHTYVTIKTPPQIRFWKKVKKSSPNKCWPFVGDKTHHGYGRFTEHPRKAKPGHPKPTPTMAHRLAWEYTYGKIPDGLSVCHHCDNRPCCNPTHLFLGTQQDNNRDRHLKGRTVAVRGEMQGSSKLTEKQVREIRSQYQPFKVSLNSLAKKFAVSKRTILFIVQGRYWRHVR
jgi:hypothetical protein